MGGHSCQAVSRQEQHQVSTTRLQIQKLSDTYASLKMGRKPNGMCSKYIVGTSSLRTNSQPLLWSSPTMTSRLQTNLPWILLIVIALILTHFERGEKLNDVRSTPFYQSNLKYWLCSIRPQIGISIPVSTVESDFQRVCHFWASLFEQLLTWTLYRSHRYVDDASG